jgi:hypothetical protein
MADHLLETSNKILQFWFEEMPSGPWFAIGSGIEAMACCSPITWLEQ